MSATGAGLRTEEWVLHKSHLWPGRPCLVGNVHSSPALKSCLASRTRSYRIQRNQVTNHQQMSRDVCGRSPRPSTPCTWPEERENSHRKSKLMVNSVPRCVYGTGRQSVNSSGNGFPKRNVEEANLEEGAEDTRSSEIVSRCSQEV